MKNKVVSFLFVVGISFLTIMEFVNAGTFSDISDSYIYKDAVSYASSNSIVNGYSDGTFRPFNNITRAEFTKILVNSKYSKVEIDNCMSSNFLDGADEGAVGFSNVFPDVIGGMCANGPVLTNCSGDKFANYICMAKVKGLINGYSDGNFYPQRNITSAEAMKIVSNTKGYTSAQTIPSSTNKFKIYVDAIASRKAIPASIPNLDYLIQRGEIVEMIYRLDTNITSKTSMTYATLTGTPEENASTNNFKSLLTFNSSKWSYHNNTEFGFNYETLSLIGDPYYENGVPTYLDKNSAKIIDPTIYRQEIDAPGFPVNSYSFKYYCSFTNSPISSTIRNNLNIGEAVIDFGASVDITKSKIIIDLLIDQNDYQNTTETLYSLPGIQKVPVFGSGSVVNSYDSNTVRFYSENYPARLIMCEKNGLNYEVKFVGIGILDSTDSYNTKYNFTNEMQNILTTY